MIESISSLTGSVAEKVHVFIVQAPEYIRTGYHAASSQTALKVLELIEKTKTLWVQLLPYIRASIIFCMSPIGISIVLLSLSTIPLSNARCSSSTAARIAWFSLGIITACAGAYLLSTTGVIPPLLSMRYIV